MKTLQQLWTENNEKPFWAKWEDDAFYCVGISPRSIATGWNEDGDIERWNSSSEGWLQIDDPNKPKPKMRVWECGFKIVVSENDPSMEEYGCLDRYVDITDELREALKGKDDEIKSKEYI